MRPLKDSCCLTFVKLLILLISDLSYRPFNLPIGPYKGIQGSLGFWIPRPRFQIPDTGFWILDSLLVELGFRIPIVSGIPDSLSLIQNSTKDSTSKHFRDSGFRREHFPGFRNPNSLAWADTNLLWQGSGNYKLDVS